MRSPKGARGYLEDIPASRLGGTLEKQVVKIGHTFGVDIFPFEHARCSWPMATILAHINVVEGQEQDFEHIASEMYQATHNNESGVRRYEYWRGEQPGMYNCLLAFDDFRSFLVHQSSPHHEAPGWGSVLAGIRLEWGDPVRGGSALPSTQPQKVADDASDLMKEYAKTYAVARADWRNQVDTQT